MYDVARQVTDEVLGEGTYADINKGNPDPGVQAAIARGPRTGYAIYFPTGTKTFPQPHQYFSRELRRVANPLFATIFVTEDEAAKKAELEWGPAETQIVRVRAIVEVLDTASGSS